MARRYAAPDGWTLKAFQFALDPTPEQWQTIRRQWGGRRYADNWAVRTLKADLEAYHATGESREPPRSPDSAGAGTAPRPRSAWMGRRARSGGLRSRRKPSPTASRTRWMPTGAGSSPGPASSTAAESGAPHEAGFVGTRSASRGSSARAETRTAAPSAPGHFGSSLIAATSPCPGSAPCGRARTLADWSGWFDSAGRASSPPP